MNASPSRRRAADIAAAFDLRGKQAVITGGTSGLGQETARVLAARGANVMFSGRDAERGAAMARSLGEANPGAKIEFLPLDLMSLDSIDAFCRDVAARCGRIDFLVLNAGMMTPTLSRNAEGVEAQFMCNYVGHLMIASALARLLIAGAPSRIVSLTSSGHKLSDVRFDDINFNARPYDGLLAYGQSKTASSLLAVELNRRLSPSRVLAFAVHPGVVLDTDLSRHVGGRANEEEQIKKYNVPRSALMSLEEGAATIVWAALDQALAGTGGGQYLEDCRVSAPSEDKNPYAGVLPYAVSASAAAALCSAAEQMIGRRLSA